ncbi:MAG: acylphosphatase [Phycisphaerales bacterium]|nr:acylphosphatase [Phycisphaerales bacterium]
MRTRILYTGRVQGVGFRATTRSVASNYPILSGFVRNEPSGQVLVEVQGPPEQVEAFLSQLHTTMQRNITHIDRAVIPDHQPAEPAFSIQR